MCEIFDNIYLFIFFITIVLARYITTFAAIISILIAFVESQITFCILNKSQLARKRSKCNRNRRGQYVDNDQAADLEYVIPKVTKIQISFI